MREAAVFEEASAAGENMDSHEWGFEICVDGEEEPSLFLFGSRQADSGRFDPAGLSPEAVQLGSWTTVPSSYACPTAATSCV